MAKANHIPSAEPSRNTSHSENDITVTTELLANSCDLATAFLHGTQLKPPKQGLLCLFLLSQEVTPLHFHSKAAKPPQLLPALQQRSCNIPLYQQQSRAASHAPAKQQLVSALSNVPCQSDLLRFPSLGCFTKISVSLETIYSSSSLNPIPLQNNCRVEVLLKTWPRAALNKSSIPLAFSGDS